MKVVAPYVKTWLLAAALALALPLTSQGREEVAASSQANNGVTGRPFPVDMVWGGTGVAYDAIAVGNVVYVAYYDDERRLCVTRIDTRTGERTKKTLDSRFKGWDAHNNVTLEVDRDGILHVAANMHVVPLVYGRTRSRDDFDSLTLLNKMVGQDEQRVTYPRFFKLPSGELGFSYRSGSSGDGVEIINRFDGERWHRVLDKPLFGSDPGGMTVNAYHSGYIKGPDGLFHVAWVWRDKPAVETNFNVNYARSKDLLHWTTSNGKPLDLPMTPATVEVVDPVPMRSGLFNNIRVGFTVYGAPIISYLKYDGTGNSQLFHARPTATGRWKIVQATNWDYRWDFRGGGTLTSEISFSGVRSEAGRLVEDVVHRKYGKLRFEVQAGTLAANPVPMPTAKVQPLGRSVPVEAPYRINSRAARPIGPRSIDAVVRWQSFGSENNDRPRSCASSGLPEGCAMTSTMELFVR